MGALRTLLAGIVVLAHIYGEVGVGGRLAVQLFYMISGFLIAHVLQTNPAYADPLRFYTNRALRIYPAYWVVALATLAYVTFVDRSIFETYRHLPTGAALLTGVSNVTLFGQDWVMFAGVADGHLRFFSNFRLSDPPLWEGLLVPQAWTLGVELTFYAIAPFVLRRPAVTWGLLLLSCGVRGVTWALGWGATDPWTYRFFPSELSLFLLGAISNRYLLPAWMRTLPARHRGAATSLAVGVLLLSCISYHRWPAAETVKLALLLAAVALLLPLAFLFQQHWRLDKAIGNLSYPVYIAHMLVIWSTRAAMSAFGLSFDTRSTALVVLLASFLAAVALDRLVIEPAEIWRRRVRSPGPVTNGRERAPPILPIA